MWGAPDHQYHKNFFSSAKEMYKKGGFRSFLVGSWSTLIRDVIFGGIYGILRYSLHPYVEHEDCRAAGACKYVINMFSGCCATVISSPFNYVRNMQYSYVPGPKNSKLTSRTILYTLYQDACKQEVLIDKCIYVQRQFRVGWGTARVGCGMAFSEQIYQYCIKKM